MPLRNVLLFLVLIGLLAPAVLIGLWDFLTLSQQAQTNFLAAQKRLASTLVSGARELMWNFDTDSAQDLVNTVAGDSRVNSAILEQPDGTVFVGYHAPSQVLKNQITTQYLIVHGRQIIGKLVLGMDPAFYFDQVALQMTSAVLVLASQLVLSLVLIGVSLNRRFLVPIRILEMQALRLARQDLAEPFNWSSADELGRLGRGLESTRQSLSDYKEHLEDLIEARTAELKTANSELEAFSYSVSHDLRAPLRGIGGYAGALVEDFGADLDPKAHEYLARIQRSVAKMSDLIDDLLGLSRASRSQIHPMNFDLAKLAYEVASELQAAQPEHQVDFSCSGPLTVFADPGLMRIAMQNLLGNAWKYTEKTPQPRVWMRAVKVPAESETVYVIEDNGTGFAMQDTSQLFEPFFRFHSSSEFAGNGIGLAVVARIMARHRGRVWAEGTAGQGACFSFTLGELLPEELV